MWLAILAGFDPGRALKLFPPKAIAQGLTTSLGMARCVSGQDGGVMRLPIRFNLASKT